MISIAIASDHAGREYKTLLKSHLESKGINVKDFGTNSAALVDYPEFVRAATRSVVEGQSTLGIIVGGKEHGDCNMIAIGQCQMSKEEAVAIVDTWLAAEFEGGRHQRRIDQIDG